MTNKILKKVNSAGLAVLMLANTGAFGAVIENKRPKLKSQEKVARRVEPTEEKGAWYYTKKIGSAVFKIGVLGGLVVTNRAFAPVVFNGVRLVLDKDEIMIPLIYCASRGISIDDCLRKVYLQQTCKTTEELKAKLEKMWTFNLRSLKNMLINPEWELFEWFDGSSYDVIESGIKYGNNFLLPLKKTYFEGTEEEKEKKKEEFNKKLNSEFIDFDNKKINTKTWDKNTLKLIDEILEKREKWSQK